MSYYVTNLSDKLSDLNLIPNQLYAITEQQSFVSSKLGKKFLELNNERVSPFQQSKRHKTKFNSYLSDLKRGSQSEKNKLKILSSYIESEYFYYGKKLPLGSTAGILVLNIIMTMDSTSAWPKSNSEIIIHDKNFDCEDFMRDVLGPNMRDGYVPEKLYEQYERIIGERLVELDSDKGKNESKNEASLPSKQDSKIIGWLLRLGLIDYQKVVAIKHLMPQTDLAELEKYIDDNATQNNDYNYKRQETSFLENIITEFISENLRCLILGVGDYMDIFNKKVNKTGSTAIPLTSKQIQKDIGNMAGTATGPFYQKVSKGISSSTHISISPAILLTLSADLVIGVIGYCTRSKSYGVINRHGITGQVRAFYLSTILKNWCSLLYNSIESMKKLPNGKHRHNSLILLLSSFNNFMYGLKGATRFLSGRDKNSLHTHLHNYGDFKEIDIEAFQYTDDTNYQTIDSNIKSICGPSKIMSINSKDMNEILHRWKNEIKRSRKHTLL